MRRNSALLDGSVGIAITLLAVLLALGLIPGIVAVCGMLLVLVPYATVLALSRPALKELPLPQPWRRFVASAASDKEKPDANTPEKPGDSSQGRAAVVGKVLLELAVIIVGSTGLVRYATRLTAGRLPQSLLGSVLIAALTGIPNLYTAVRLGIKHRGSAVVTETMNSNSLNALVGLGVPALVLGPAPAHKVSAFAEVYWLLAMTCAVVAVMVASRGMKRWQGGAVLLAYGAFVAARVLMA